MTARRSRGGSNATSWSVVSIGALVTLATLGAAAVPPASAAGQFLEDEVAASVSPEARSSSFERGRPPVGVAVFDDTEGDVLAVSVFGNATGGRAAASVTGDADACETRWGDFCDGYLAVSGTGDATGGYAVTATGTADGTFPFSVTGDCRNEFTFYNSTSGQEEVDVYSARCFAVDTESAAHGYWTGFSLFGDASGAIGMSGTGTAGNSRFCLGLYPLYVSCVKRGGIVTASGTGTAEGESSFIGASVSGPAHGGVVATSILGPAHLSPNVGVGPAVSVAGPATSCQWGFYGCAAVSVFGPASADTAVSVFGEASGDRAVSACNEVDPLCWGGWS